MAGLDDILTEANRMPEVKAQRVLELIEQIPEETAEVSFEIFKDFATKWYYGDKEAINAWIGLAGSYFKPVKVYYKSDKYFIVPPIMHQQEIYNSNIDFFRVINDFHLLSDTFPAKADDLTKETVKTLRAQIPESEIKKVEKEAEDFLSYIKMAVESEFDINKLDRQVEKTNKEIEDDEDEDEVWD